MSHKYIEVYLDEWDTDELIDELKYRASNGDKEAQEFLGITPKSDLQLRSAAECLSTFIDTGTNSYRLTPQNVIDTPGYGFRSIQLAEADARRKLLAEKANG